MTVFIEMFDVRSGGSTYGKRSKSRDKSKKTLHGPLQHKEHATVPCQTMEFQAETSFRQVFFFSIFLV